MDGRFIEKFSWVDVAGANKSSFRRARVAEITPDYMRVDYYTPDGKKTSDSENIETARISQSVRKAAEPQARLDAPQAEPTPQAAPAARGGATKAAETLMSSAAGTRFAAAVDRFNTSVDTSSSLNTPGDPVAEPVQHEDMGFTGNEAVSEIFQSIREKQDRAFTAHQQFVAETLRNASSSGLNLDGAFKDEQGDWSPEARAYMDAIVDEMMADLESRGVPKGRQALMMGGLPGAGKTTVVGSYGLDMGKWAVSNPDDVKELMVRDGIYPKLAGLSPMEMAGPMHEMSSDIAKEFSARIIKSGFNMVADITMGGHPKRETGLTGAESTAEHLAAQNYTLDAVFVDVPTSMSAVSQNQRHLNGINKLRSGESPLGGRYVPEFILEESDLGNGTKDTLNRRNFEKMKADGRFARWYVLDNTDYKTAPLLIGRGAEPGRPPAYDSHVNDRGQTVITLKESVGDIPGMYE